MAPDQGARADENSYQAGEIDALRSDAMENKYAWLTGQGWHRLHYFAGITHESWGDWWEHDADPGYLNNALVAACGQTVHATLPGIFSRLGMTRCARCCAAVGIPTGNGAPVNEGSLKANISGSQDGGAS